MTISNSFKVWLPAALLLACLPVAFGQGSPDAKQTVKVPVVMEQATVRGKVAILETKREDRKILEGLKIQVWGTKEIETEEEGKHSSTKKKKHYERDQLLHETETDEAGLFDLPLLDPGEYYLVTAEVQFRLSVMPQNADRQGQSEPKVLLILIPKEVVEDDAASS